MQNVPAMAMPLDPLLGSYYLHTTWNESRLPTAKP